MTNVKYTPPCCHLNRCSFNILAPPVNSQECIGCPALKDPHWQPKLRRPT